MDSRDVCQLIIEYSKLCYDRNLVSAAGGNISMRNGNSVFITATNAPLRQLAFQDIVELDMAGNIIGDNQAKKPSKEAGMHLAVYNARPEINCVLHLHPTYAIISSMTYKDAFPCPTVSSKLKIIDIGFVPYADAGSPELLAGVRAALAHGSDKTKIILLEGHGTLNFDVDMMSCFNTAELLEATAKINVLMTAINPSHAEPVEVG